MKKTETVTLSESTTKIAQEAGKFAFLQTYIQILIDVNTRSLERHEKEMQDILDSENRSWEIKLTQSFITEAKAKIEVLKDLQIK